MSMYGVLLGHAVPCIPGVIIVPGPVEHVSVAVPGHTYIASLLGRNILAIPLHMIGCEENLPYIRGSRSLASMPMQV